MKRREFLCFMSGATATPFFGTRSVLAQTERQRRIGFVGGISEAEWRPLIQAFGGQLKDLGWIEGRTFVLDVRAAAGDFSRLEIEAASLVAAKADVIVALGTPGLNAVRRQTHVVPIVFLAVTDPAGQGLIDSLAHPGGNATGLTNFEFSIASKWVELLREVDRNITRVTLIFNSANSSYIPYRNVISEAAQSLGIEVISGPVTNAEEIKGTIASASEKSGSSLIVLPDSLPFVHRELIVGLAAQRHLPAIYPFREFSTTGGLMSYGLDQTEVYRSAAIYADKVLRGTNPAELPVQAPNKFELVINLKTAKSLGIEIPPRLLFTADEVIE